MGTHSTEYPAKIGCTAETLRRWVRQAERDSGMRGLGRPRTSVTGCGRWSVRFGAQASQ
jgi:transposase-like protein